MQTPLLVSAAIITKNDNFFLVKRAREPYKNYWSFISGCGGFKDTYKPEEVVKIEVLGDIDCEFFPHFLTYNFSSFEIPTITFFFIGEIGGTPKIASEYISDYKWVSKHEILNFNLAFEQNEIIKKYIKERYRK